jgi:hypothetical protein
MHVIQVGLGATMHDGTVFTDPAGSISASGTYDRDFDSFTIAFGGATVIGPTNSYFAGAC